MKIKLLRDYRGWITNETFIKAGEHDVDKKTADMLIKHGRAVAIRKGKR